MAQKAIREYTAKKMMLKYLQEYLHGEVKYSIKTALVTPDCSLDDLVEQETWIKNERLVVKPDMLIGKRGKNKLILLDGTIDKAKKWISENNTAEISGVKGKLTHFLVEPFIPHDKEYYLAIKDYKEGDHIYFSASGGIDIEENWDKVITINIPIEKEIDEIDLKTSLSQQILGNELDFIADFIYSIFSFYKNLHYTYLEFNPFVIKNNIIIPLDCVARLDDTATFWMQEKWRSIEFPSPFGSESILEEKYIKDLDEKSGASLKLTVLNPKGRIWTMIAGGGASVIYTDSVVDSGHGKELANYGEYSGNPSLDETYEYAKTILDLMTREKHPDGKILIIGGGIANFTDVAKTFQGIIKAIREFRDKLLENNVKIYVRRGGPNYLVGLKQMKEVGEELGLPIEVHGPEMNLTRIVTIALKDMGIINQNLREG
ncbi:MAG: ATP citrate lyase citrate-binding domain-containing protein [Promethearchaeota archaeon]